MSGRIIDFLLRFLKIGQRAWKPGGVSASVILTCDAFQPVFPFIWVAAIVGVSALALLYYFRRVAPQAAPKLLALNWFFGLLVGGAAVVALLQVVVPDAGKIGLVAAISPEVQKAQKIVMGCNPGDPREYLNCKGIAWTAESFGNAIGNRDTEVVSLFVRGGWKLDSDQFLGLITGDHYDLQTLKPVVDGKAVRSVAFCTGYENQAIALMGISNALSTGSDPYTRAIARLTEKPEVFGEFVRICGAQKLRDHYAGLIRQEREAAQKNAAAATPQAIDRCVSELRSKLPFEQAILKASTFNILDHLVLSGETMVLAELNQALIFGRRADDLRRVYQNASDKACRQSAPKQPAEASVNLRNYEKIMQAIK